MVLVVNIVGFDYRGEAKSDGFDSIVVYLMLQRDVMRTDGP